MIERTAQLTSISPEVVTAAVEHERAILLVCAGMELNAAFGPLCAAAHGDPAQPYPTFSLALAALAASEGWFGMACRKR